MYLHVYSHTLVDTDDIVVYFTQFLTTTDVNNMERVCRTWRQLLLGSQQMWQQRLVSERILDPLSLLLRQPASRLRQLYRRMSAWRTGLAAVEVCLPVDSDVNFSWDGYHRLEPTGLGAVCTVNLVHITFVAGRSS